MNARQAVVVAWALAVGGAWPAAGQAKWMPPRCDLKPGHFLVNSGLLYVKSATESRYEDQKKKDLAEANRVLTDALANKGQDKNGAAWYWFARRYAMLDDLAGADSAFRRAAQLAPQCQGDIELWRRDLWRPMFNRGVEAYQAGKMDSAIHYFRAASVIHAEPTGLSAVATLYATSGEADSAVRYYGETIRAAAGPDTQHLRIRREALFNRGAVLNQAAHTATDSAAQAARWSQSEAAFKEYLAEYPADPQALAGLAAALTRTGRQDSALAVYRSIVANAKSAEVQHLAQAGVEMFNATPNEPDSTAIADSCVAQRRGRQPAGAAARQRAQAATAGCEKAAADSMAAYRGAARPFLQGAAAAFDSALTKSAGDRTTLFNLTNTYYRLGEGTPMLATARKLYAVDPMNRGVLLLLAQAWRLQGKTDSTLWYLQYADSALPAEVTVSNFTVDEQGGTVNALVTNRREGSIAPMTLVFEFIDAKGGVLATQNAEVPSLAAGVSHQVEVRATGQGIMAWRYRRQ